jgi:hypothetical protein
MFEAPGWVSTSFDPTLGFPGEGPSTSPVPQWRFNSTPAILQSASLPSPGSRWRRWAIGILQGTIPCTPTILLLGYQPRTMSTSASWPSRKQVIALPLSLHVSNVTPNVWRLSSARKPSLPLGLGVGRPTTLRPDLSNTAGPVLFALIRRSRPRWRLRSLTYNMTVRQWRTLPPTTVIRHYSHQHRHGNEPHYV